MVDTLRAVLSPLRSDALQRDGLTERRYRREARYSKQLRVTVQPATAAALESEADATQTSVSAVIRDAVARGLPLVKDARRKQRQRGRHAAGAGEA